MKAEPATIVIKRGQRKSPNKSRARWKSALADFSMVSLALFVMLWMVESTTPEQKAAIAGYFKTPGDETQILAAIEKARIAELELQAAAKARLKDPEPDYSDLVAEIEQQTARLPEKISKALEISMSPEGLRLEIRELKDRPMFARGSDKLMPAYMQIVLSMAPRLAETGSNIMVLGHTDATRFARDAKRDNWDLSTARAQKTRRALIAGGFPAERIIQVVGMADRQLRDPDHPNDASNRRVEIILSGGLPTLGKEAAPSGTLKNEVSESARKMVTS